ncbi:MAG: V-type ATPase subunit [Ruminococcus sp.]|nr:V-type ATPase subunit [Ruminococcus sp.]
MDRTTRYADAVAAVKAMENLLMNRSDIEQLINASGKAEFDALLSSKRGISDEFSTESVWEFIHSYAPESRELEILLYRNDFHNLKAALKAMVSGRTAEKYFIRPTNVDLERLPAALAEKDYSILPEHMRRTAQEAYELIVRTSDGQLADSFIDTETLRAMQKKADESGSEFMKEYARLVTVCADIKTAYRCSRMKKQRVFLETAICGSPKLDKESLIYAVLDGTESLMKFLEESGFAEAVELLNKSAVEFEKWCDDLLMELAETAHMQSFGAEPLAAYYIAAEAEQQNLRIISVCREFGADRETIMERMRKLYV